MNRSSHLDEYILLFHLLIRLGCVGITHLRIIENHQRGAKTIMFVTAQNYNNYHNTIAASALDLKPYRGLPANIKYVL